MMMMMERHHRGGKHVEEGEEKEKEGEGAQRSTGRCSSAGCHEARSSTGYGCPRGWRRRPPWRRGRRTGRARACGGGAV